MTVIKVIVHHLLFVVSKQGIKSRYECVQCLQKHPQHDILHIGPWIT